MTLSAEDFRAERLQIIRDRKDLYCASNVVVHLIPVPLETDEERLDLRSVDIDGRLFQGGYNQSPNYDGRIFEKPTEEGVARYAQFFRHGAFEFVDSFILRNEKSIVPSRAFEDNVLLAAQNGVRSTSAAGGTFPLKLAVSVLNVRGWKMAFPNAIDTHDNGRPIDVDDLLPPAVMVEREDVELESLLHPVFDRIWQAAGVTGSIYYLADGKRTSR